MDMLLRLRGMLQAAGTEEVIHEGEYHTHAQRLDISV